MREHDRFKLFQKVDITKTVFSDEKVQFCNEFTLENLKIGLGHCSIFPITRSMTISITKKEKLLPIMQNTYKGPFKYYVCKEVGGWGQKMAIFDDLQYCKSSKRWVGLKKSKT